jgi:hypothetical protein
LWRTPERDASWRGSSTPPQWIEFRRLDAGAVIDMVRAVADAHDPGEYGDGVEVVIEAPRVRGLAGLFNKDDELAQARIVVTSAGGEVGYPFDIQLVTAYGARAAHRVGARPGRAVSNTAGLAFLIQKGRPGQRYDFGSLVGGAVAALEELRRRPMDKGWRAMVDRSVHRV